MKLMMTLVLALSVLSCSSKSNTEKVLYKTSKALPSLEIPPDLTTLDDTENKRLPNSLLGTKAATARYKDTGPLLDAVLPKISGVELKGVGNYHWLEVAQSPSQLYPTLKAFWIDEGFKLEQDEPLIGIMKTEWLENKASLLSSDESMIGRFLKFFESTDTEDQYKVRIERGDTQNSSKVFLTQYGKEFVLVTEDNVNIKSWQERAPNPELEVEMLSRMMLFLGLQDEQIKQQLTKIGKFPKRAKLVKNEVETLLVIKESFDRGWNRVLVQLDRLDVDYELKDKEKAIIRFSKTVKKEDKGLFSTVFSDSLNKDSEVITMTLELGETSGNATTVKVVNSQGTNDSSDQAKALLDYLLKGLK